MPYKLRTDLKEFNKLSDDDKAILLYHKWQKETDKELLDFYEAEINKLDWHIIYKGQLLVRIEK